MKDEYKHVDDFVSDYNVLKRMLNKHAPAVTKTVVVQPEAPWYNEEINQAKQVRRKAKKVWRKTKLTIHREICIAEKEKVNSMIRDAKVNHYTNIIADAKDKKESIQCHERTI